MKVKDRKIQTIRPYDTNPKRHPEKQIEQIVASIREFGWQQPIVIDKLGVIIAGHGRYYAAIEMGLDTIPVVEAKTLTKKQANAYRLADNKIAESEWDMNMVVEELMKIETENLQKLTGFDLDLLVTPEPEDDEVPETPQEPKSQRGQIYQLGDHRLMCGDATDKKDVDRLLEGKKSDMIFTDPPYNVNYISLDTVRSLQRGRDRQVNYEKQRIENDNLPEEQFQKLLDKTLAIIKATTKPEAALYICYGFLSQNNFFAAINKTGYVATQIVWVKENMVLSFRHYQLKHEAIAYCEEAERYQNRHEMMWYCQNEKKTTKWYGDRKQTSVWTVARDKKKDYVHPTQKPVELIVRALVNSSRRGDMITDLYGGSGSTLIACEKTERHARIMEIDPIFVDTIIQRWEIYTGKEAVLIDK